MAITCNVGVALLGKDSFQEIDIAGITMPITKHNYIVKDVNDLADTIRKAFVTHRQDVRVLVLDDIPERMLQQIRQNMYLRRLHRYSRQKISAEKIWIMHWL